MKDLSLSVFQEGVFEFATRTEGEDGGKGVIQKASSETPPGARTRVVFNRWEKKYTISYEAPCN